MIQNRYKRCPVRSDDFHVFHKNHLETLKKYGNTNISNESYIYLINRLFFEDSGYTDKSNIISTPGDYNKLIEHYNSELEKIVERECGFPVDIYYDARNWYAASNKYMNLKDNLGDGAYIIWKKGKSPYIAECRELTNKILKEKEVAQ